MASDTNQPVRFLGRQPFRKLPIAHLSDVAAAEQLALERDLHTAPTPISGGMRKALKKETALQDGLRRRTIRRYGEADLRRAYGLYLASCPRCDHAMFFDEIAGDVSSLRCDRCRRPIW